jgi:Aspartyl/Asparaginyl beta-hydroxylase
VTTVALAGLKLPFRFNPALLQHDLALVEPEDWSPHYNENDFGGQWQGASLRSASGSHRDIVAGSPGQGSAKAPAFKDTSLLTRCGYFREVLLAFPCPLKSVRLLSLAPGSFIREHTDHALGYEDGEIRLHIPIRTNPGVEFYVCGERLLLEEANCYYVNVNLPHRVNNRGAAARVHLVIDALVDDWVRFLFEASVTRGDEIPRSCLPPGGFDQFMDLVFSDEILREELRAIPDRAGLVNAVVREAASRGFDLNEADVEAAFRSRPCVSQPGDGWMPIRISFHESKPMATWIYAPDHRFIEPFFEDNVRTCLRNPFTALFQREMPLGPPDAAIRPQGFIFHMSRCGSTLISRSLAAAESTFVMSEPAPLDDIIQENRPEWLEWIVSALGRTRAGAPTSYLIKLDAWHIRALPMFRAVFPEVPWIFVYRDPMEVLVSQLRQPGLQASPGAMDPAILGLDAADITGLTRLQWCVRVLDGFMRAALSFRDDPTGMFINYLELPGAICGRIAGHFALELTSSDEARVEAATLRDAKNPQVEFVDDHAAKRKEAESLTPDATLQALRDLYRQLDEASAR